MNHLDCYYTKTNFVVFEKTAAKHLNIVIGNHESYSCESYNYLGIHFDKKFNFDKHIIHGTVKLAQHSGILYKFRTTLNEKQIIQHFRSFISPIVQYGVLLYGLGPKTELHKIFVALKASNQDQRFRKIQRSENRNSV